MNKFNLSTLQIQPGEAALVFQADGGYRIVAEPSPSGVFDQNLINLRTIDAFIHALRHEDVMFALQEASDRKVCPKLI